MILLSSSAFDDSRLLPFSLSTTRKSIASIRACILVSASPMKANGPNAIKTMNYLTQNRVFNTKFVDLCEGRTAKDAIREADLIILNGGNPFLLLSTLQNQEYLDELRLLGSSERVVVGVSAGAMMFSPGLALVQDFNEIMGFEDRGNTHGVQDLRCLNEFDEYFFPHFDSFALKVVGLSERLDDLASQRKATIYRQNNGQTARVVERVLEEL